MPEAMSSLRGIQLRPVEPQHTPALFRWSTDLSSGFRWRFGGGTPNPTQFAEAMWAGVLCQYVVVDNSNQLVGLVICYAADHTNGHAYFAVQGNPERATGTAAMVGLLQLLDHLFSHWPFRKLYAEIPGYNEAEFVGALRRHLTIEARLIDHVYHDNRFWDMVTCSLSRDQWYNSVRPRFVAVLDASNCDEERVAS